MCQDSQRQHHQNALWWRCRVRWWHEEPKCGVNPTDNFQAVSSRQLWFGWEYEMHPWSKGKAGQQQCRAGQGWAPGLVLQPSPASPSPAGSGWALGSSPRSQGWQSCPSLSGSRSCAPSRSTWVGVDGTAWLPHLPRAGFLQRARTKITITGFHPLKRDLAQFRVSPTPLSHMAFEEALQEIIDLCLGREMQARNLECLSILCCSSIPWDSCSSSLTQEWINFQNYITLSLM